MSGSETSNKQLEFSADAFEYVTGTLSASERTEIERQLGNEPNLRDEVAFWEEQLLPLSSSTDRLAPRADLWERISSNLNTSQTSTAKPENNQRSFWASLMQWGAPTFAAALLAVVLINYYPSGNNTGGDAPVAGPAIPDYVAVLTDSAGDALLTALTTEDGNNMYLQWADQVQFSAAKSIQLWAVSKRDGQTRPLAVFADTQTSTLVLDEATWRLVTDSAFLLLTEEEEGGSPLDEPSDALLAKGVCVRFNRETTI